MKKLTHSFPAKVLAIFLLLLMGGTAVLSAGCAYYFAEEGYYDWSATDGPVKTSYLESQFAANAAYSFARAAGERRYYTRYLPETGRVGYEASDAAPDAASTIPPAVTPMPGVLPADAAEEPVVYASPTPWPAGAGQSATPEPTLPQPVPTPHAYQNGWFSSDAYDRKLSTALTNFRYELFDENTGERLETNLAEGEDATPVLTSIHRYDSDAEYRVECYVVTALPVNDVFAAQSRIFGTAYAFRNAVFYIGAGALLLAVLLLIFLLCAAGRHGDSPEPRRGWFDKIPFDLLCALYLVSAVLTIRSTSLAGSADYLFVILVCALAAAVILLLALALLMTLAVRVKTHTFLKNNVFVQVVLLIYRVARWAVCGIGKILKSLPIIWKGLGFFVMIGILEMLLIFNAQDGGVTFFLFALFNLGLLAFVAAALMQMNRLKRGGEALAAGQMEQRVDEKGMLPAFKRHAENLNAIGLGLNRAVEARMKSERMKTDLITNVSHDLKTPLTSIVNYVDLLRKEELQNETAKGYIEVLERQAQKLKKLTEDLVEASKASSGTINVNLAPTSVTELLNQSLAEYAERLAGVPLTVVTSISDGTLTVLADGRLLWRVFDNLLNNAAKYALPGTRLYCTAAAASGRVTVMLKNVSREALNVSPDELMERFVRGDASRTTEGSGLGLSIARSLVELQSGTFRILIDGDLFTAEVSFPAA